MSEISSIGDRILVEKSTETKPNWPKKIVGDELKQWLPHRGIALCLGEVRYEKTIKIRGFWTPDERYFEGHFNVLPGHWIGESASLTGAILGQLYYEDLKGAVPLLGPNDGVPAKPLFKGGSLIHDVVIRSRKGRELSFYYKTSDDKGSLIAAGHFSGTAVPEKLFFKMLTRMAA